MNLKRLDLSGFKSFARSTPLEFASNITAIVGPNGSGKSNIVEAIQWALGEQSLKGLRGKKGEDLIFNGSEKAAPLGRASVTLIFDNSKKQFPLEFEEVEIQRKVYRDGVNEYFINGSKVRLKDIIELLANIGIGASRHHIISQGESDHILYAAPEERREMIEDALGLKIYQLKRRESERKLEGTEENIKQAEALRKEIQPHLKFLKIQVEKFQATSKLREDLVGAYQQYLNQEKSYLISKEETLTAEKSSPQKELQKIEKELSGLSGSFDPADSFLEKEMKDVESKIQIARNRRLGMERELGKIEGMIESKQEEKKEGDNIPIERHFVEGFLEKIENEIGRAISEKFIEEIAKILNNIRLLIKDFSSSVLRKKENKGAEDLKNLFLLQEKAAADLEKLRRDENELNERYFSLRSRDEKERKTKTNRGREFFEKQSRLNILKDELRSFRIEEDKLNFEKSEFERYLNEAEHYQIKGPFPAVDFSDSSRQNLKKTIERLKIKLEEAGGLDRAIMTEYDETLSRDQFLDKELKDLYDAAFACKKLIKDLEKKLEEEFERGVLKVNAEFQKFFANIFGGGKASLKINPLATKKEKDEILEEKEAARPGQGVDISVDIPRKRIKTLDALSGGERALTAIALLFAVSSVKPPPFLILDEADAALDEANSKRYAELLDLLGKKTQLIIITHNRETMKQAGILYGVTMGSDSISRLLSVKLEKAEEIIKQ